MSAPAPFSGPSPDPRTSPGRPPTGGALSHGQALRAVTCGLLGGLLGLLIDAVLPGKPGAAARRLS